MAQESGLVPALLLLQEPASGGHAAAVLQQLLEVTAALAASQGQQGQQLKAHQVADLAAAFDRLCRPLQRSSGSLASAASNSSSSRDSAVLPFEASAGAAAAAAETDVPAAADLNSQTEEGQQLLSQFVAAVGALAGAAQQLAAAAAPGQLSADDTVYDVSKMLAAFGRMQVTDEGLYQALLRHWTPQCLQASSMESGVGAARAATWLAMAQPGLVSRGGLPLEVGQPCCSCVRSDGRG
ncbi:hypothetical protein COO60DRAFT_767692 [Scenedesmus sp. NREL 46B-D3]|nr:hypothetical protein COO60DRAFT_767692 [Scenedesmus sp. NREL 46B-D3]